MKLYKKTVVKSVVAGVSIKQASPNAYSIYWCKLVPLQGQKNKFSPLTIAKGNGKHKYPASSFEFVEYPYRHLVLQVEGRLAEIRRVASENRQLRRTLVAYEKKLSRESGAIQVIQNGRWKGTGLTCAAWQDQQLTSATLEPEGV